MSWFSTSGFHFELPGDEWEERTLQVFRPTDDERSIFIIGRAKPPPEGAPDAGELLASLPMGPYEERKVLKREWRKVGPLEGEDISLFARAGADGEYYRFISVAYYDLEVTFQFAGPMAAREQVDARVERTLDSVKFRSR